MGELQTSMQYPSNLLLDIMYIISDLQTLAATGCRDVRLDR